MLNFVYHSYYYSKRRTRCDDVGNDGVWCVVGVGSDERIQDGANCRVLGRRDCLGTLRECGRGFVDGTQRDGHGDVNVVGRVRHANHQVVRRRRGVIVDGCTNTLALRTWLPARLTSHVRQIVARIIFQLPIYIARQNKYLSR